MDGLMMKTLEDLQEDRPGAYIETQMTQFDRRVARLRAIAAIWDMRVDQITDTVEWGWKRK